MTIRTKLLLLFSITFLALTLAAAYLVSFYRVTLNSEREISHVINSNIELAHQSKSEIQAQLNAWKSVLLRGDEARNYHRFLQGFYTSERQAAVHLSELNGKLQANTKSAELLSEIKLAHLAMGRNLRQAMRKHNESADSAGVITDRYEFDFEDRILAKLKELISVLETQRQGQFDNISQQRSQREQIIVMLMCSVLGMSLVLYLWFVDKSILNPTLKAKFLADVVNNA